jgi:hypothetical protein
MKPFQSTFWSFHGFEKPFAEMFEVLEISRKRMHPQTGTK